MGNRREGSPETRIIVLPTLRNASKPEICREKWGAEAGSTRLRRSVAATKDSGLVVEEPGVETSIPAIEIKQIE
jgi:hypothetical protein